jgi:hypothetical protein
MPRRHPRIIAGARDRRAVNRRKRSSFQSYYFNKYNCTDKQMPNVCLIEGGCNSDCVPHISKMEEHSLELRELTKDDALVIQVRGSVDHWNNGDLKSFSERFREDAVLSLPLQMAPFILFC